MIRDQRIDHARRAGGVIGRIAIDQHVDIGIDVGEHAPDHMALALAAFAAHLGAGLARHRHGAIRRIVVVDEDLRPIGSALRKSATTVATAASSLKHGTRTAIRIEDVDFWKFRFHEGLSTQLPLSTIKLSPAGDKLSFHHVYSCSIRLQVADR